MLAISKTATPLNAQPVIYESSIFLLGLKYNKTPHKELTQQYRKYTNTHMVVDAVKSSLHPLKNTT